jgi:hypothetical protein
MGKLSIAPDHQKVHGREEGPMTFVQWGERYYAVKPNGDVFDSSGQIELIPDGLKKAIKEAKINEEPDRNS